MTINSDLVRASEKQARHDALERLARGKRKSGAGGGVRAGVQASGEEPRIVSSLPSEGIRTNTPSEPYRPRDPRTAITRHALPRLRFTASSPVAKPNAPRPSQAHGVPVADLGPSGDSDLNEFSSCDANEAPVQAMTRVQASVSTSEDSQRRLPADQLKPGEDFERVGKNLPLERAKRVRMELEKQKQSERQQEIQVVLARVGQGHNSVDESMDTHGGKGDHVSTANDNEISSGEERGPGRKEVRGQIGRRESSLERDLAEITASQARQLLKQIPNEDGEVPRIPFQDITHNRLGNHQYTPAEEDTDRQKLNDSKSPDDDHPGASPASWPHIEEGQDSPLRAAKRPRLPTKGVTAGSNPRAMSGMGMTDHLLKILETAPPPPKSTRQIKQEQMARRVAAKRRLSGRQQTLTQFNIAPQKSSSSNGDDETTGTQNDRNIFNKAETQTSTSQQEDEEDPTDEEEQQQHCLSPTQLNTATQMSRRSWGRKSVRSTQARSVKEPAWADQNESRDTLSQR